jgi:hypothetical protein
MFASAETIDDEQEKQDLETMRKAFAKVFADSGKTILSYKSLTAAFSSWLKCSIRTAQTRIAQARRNGILKTQLAGIYELAKTETPDK